MPCILQVVKGRQESWVGHFFKIGTLKCQKHDIFVGSIVNLSRLKMFFVTKLFFEVVWNRVSIHQNRGLKSPRWRESAVLLKTQLFFFFWKKRIATPRFLASFKLRRAPTLSSTWAAQISEKNVFAMIIFFNLVLYGHRFWTAGHQYNLVSY